MKNLEGKKAILYRRVSTTDQKDHGNSLSNQQSRLHEYCRSNSIEVVKDFEEDCSAKDFSRPIFTKLIEYATLNKDNIDLLLVYKWDRFSRNALEAMAMVEQFKGMGIEINCSDQWINHEDPNQQIMFLINVGLPEVDNRIRKDRTIEGTRSNLKEGRWVHNQPKGYIPGRDEQGKVLMKPNPELAPLITELFNDFALGIYSQNQLRKLPKFKSLNLSKSGLSRILNQIAYSGRIKIKAYKDESEQIVDAIHTPLVSIDTYEKVQYELDNRRRIKHKPSKQNDLLPLRGYLTCSKCGGNLTGSGSRSKTGKKHYYYHCSSKNSCDERFKVALAHKSIQDEFNSLKPNEEVLNLFELILKDKFENSEKSNKSLVKNIDTKIKTLTNRKSILLDKCLDGHINDETYGLKDVELSSEIEQLKYEREQLNDYEKDAMEFTKFGIHIIKNLGSFFEKATVNTKQKLLSSIFKEKLVFDGEKYRTPILNKGIELISNSIKRLEGLKNKNGRLSFDNLPLSTRGGT